MQKLVTERSFINGRLAYEGEVVEVADAQLNGKETNLVNLDGSYERPAIVEISAIAPTGPNPTAPQQIPPDAVQNAAGGYSQPGGTLVAEVTNAQEQRIDDAGIDKTGTDTTQGDLVEQLAKAQAEIAQLRANVNQTGDPAASLLGDDDNDALVAGTAPEVVASLGEKTDEELAAIRSAEVDREKPRKTVLSAVDAEMASRTAT